MDYPSARRSQTSHGGDLNISQSKPELNLLLLYSSPLLGPASKGSPNKATEAANNIHGIYV